MKQVKITIDCLTTSGDAQQNEPAIRMEFTQIIGDKESAKQAAQRLQNQATLALRAMPIENEFTSELPPNAPSKTVGGPIGPKEGGAR